MTATHFVNRLPQTEEKPSEPNCKLDEVPDTWDK